MSEITDLRSLQEEKRILRLKMSMAEDQLQYTLSETLSMETVTNEVVKNLATRRPI
ncbi:MAG: hypothetical protein HKN32_08360, partial [Flavobacteriales bacterium]|nr:hypothetical protein [Flavobacteriales bacterium]